MKGLSDAWLQDVADSLRLPPLSPSVLNALLPAIELQIRRIVQQSHKYQRRAKASTLKVEDVNLVLSTNHLEPIYGLHLSEVLTDPLGTKGKEENKDKAKVSHMIPLAEFANHSMPPCPIKPQIALHWLAVQGIQPSVPENPLIVSAEAIEKLPSSIPKELQYLYARMTGILLAAEDGKSVQSVCRVLEADGGIQDLVPYFSKFFYSQIKQHTKKLQVTRVMIRAIRALNENPSVSLEAHLQQLLPAIFTCVVSAKLSVVTEEDHWSLRDAAADLIAMVAHKYSAKFPDLISRICKTYTDALTADKALATVYGGIVGLRALGAHITKTVLLDHLQLISAHLEGVEDSKKAEQRYAVDMCREALRVTLGKYMVHAMQAVDLPWAKPKYVVKTCNLCDLDEGLVPFYVITSTLLPHCRLVV